MPLPLTGSILYAHRRILRVSLLHRPCHIWRHIIGCLDANRHHISHFCGQKHNLSLCACNTRAPLEESDQPYFPAHATCKSAAIIPIEEDVFVSFFGRRLSHWSYTYVQNHCGAVGIHTSHGCWFSTSQPHISQPPMGVITQMIADMQGTRVLPGHLHHFLAFPCVRTGAVLCRFSDQWISCYSLQVDFAGKI